MNRLKDSVILGPMMRFSIVETAFTHSREIHIFLNSTFRDLQSTGVRGLKVKVTHFDE